MSVSGCELTDYPAGVQDSRLRGSPRLLFPTRVNWSLDREHPTEEDFRSVCLQVAKTAAPWLAALVDRATRFQSTGVAFAHVVFERELQSYNANTENTRVLVSHTAILSDPSFLCERHSIQQLEMLISPPSANCFGVAVTGLGARSGVMRITSPDPLCTVRQLVRNKWPQSTSLLLTGGWSAPPATIGPWLRDEVIPDMGLTHLRWWEWSEAFPRG